MLSSSRPFASGRLRVAQWIDSIAVHRFAASVAQAPETEPHPPVPVYLHTRSRGCEWSQQGHHAEDPTEKHRRSEKMEHERGLDADATEEGRQRADMPQVGKPKRPVADPEMELRIHLRRHVEAAVC
jgi:hypothetical protein